MNSRIVLAAFTMFSVATAGAARADDQPIEVQVVDALNKAFGVHPGFRANHAKGIVVEGSFKALPIAQTLSKAAIFSGAAIPVTVRFSASTGIPNIPDGSAGANPHGMSIKYHLADGSETDMVINSLKFFVVATGEEPPVARGPVRAAEPGLGRAHERADGHQRPAERDERGGE